MSHWALSDKELAAIMSTGMKLATIILAAMVPSLAAAQNDIADDKELYAAYCIGVLDEMKKLNIERDQELQKSIPSLSPHLEEAARQVEQRLTRFRAYIAARGFLTLRRSVEAKNGLMLAQARGQSDAQQCDATINRCLDSCRIERGTQCVEQCRDQGHACPSISRCYKADNLPF